MTPQERQLVADLFDRLSSLENAPRDPDAERAVAQGLSRAPNAVYALVQTVLLQDEALKRAEAHIRELEGGEEPQNASFLDSMRSAIFGGGAGAQGRGSVPSVPAAKWNSGQTNANPGGGGYQANAPQYGQQQYEQQPSRGGSFLGTAAAAAAGVIGGSMLFNGLSSMMGGGQRGQAFASNESERGSPWGGSDSSNSDNARDAGLNDIGGGRGGGDGQRAGLFDNNDSNDDDYSNDNDCADSGDFGGDDSDYA
jgi:hypothetical protein